MISIINFIKKQKKLILIWGFLVILQFFSYEEKYTIKTSFAPASDDSALGSAQLLNFGLQSEEISVTDLVLSHSILSNAKNLKWKDVDDVDQTIYDYYKIDQEEKKIEVMLDLLESLENDITIETNRRTNLITLSIKTDDINYGFALLKMIQDKTIERYNLIKNKQSFGKAQYIELRASEVEKSLEKSEFKLQKFLEENRSILNSPKLSIEMKRIEREIELLGQVYLTLMTQSEIAKAEEKKSTPNILIVDEPYIDDSSSLISTILSFTFTFWIFVLFIYLVSKQNIIGFSKNRN